mgnify:CR=1 FL=1
MKKVRITVMRKACYEDLMAKYENPMEDACAMEEGQVFIANGGQKGSARVPGRRCRRSSWDSRTVRKISMRDG